MSTVSTEDIASKSFGDDYISIQLQTLKQDILLEIRNELNRMKLEIIESMYILCLKTKKKNISLSLNSGRNEPK